MTVTNHLSYDKTNDTLNPQNDLIIHYETVRIEKSCTKALNY